jgi:site-specific recombinase XerD
VRRGGTSSTIPNDTSSAPSRAPYVASFDKSWRELFRHAGLPVGRKGGLTWHDLRHEFVSFLADQGGEIHEVREAARHKDIRTTARYMKAREERLKTLMGKMAMRSA